MAGTLSSFGDILRDVYSPEVMRRAMSPTPEERAEDEAKRRAELLTTPPLTEAHLDPPELLISAEVDGHCLDIRCVRVGPGKYIPTLDNLREYVEQAVETALSTLRDQLEWDREERKPL